ncbi:MAG TPA: hypothetical protein VF629_18200 [Hymenobacter sp.]|jgi:hypothetical protein|uniref:hypothetical protein n=1 Tax=Hymenobacter sp. TaxID=1898978 RepID=UPI002ED8502F
MLKRLLFGKEEQEPKAPPGPFRTDVAALAAPVLAAALRVTWLGHSRVLLELGGYRTEVAAGPPLA